MHFGMHAQKNWDAIWDAPPLKIGMQFGMHAAKNWDANWDAIWAAPLEKLGCNLPPPHRRQRLGLNWGQAVP